MKSSIHPEDYSRWQQTLRSALEGDGEFHIEYRINLPTGGLAWVEIRAQTRFDDQHRPLSMSGISLNVTDRKEAEAYRMLVTQEMSHRIKNTLATVQSIVSQSLRAELPSHELREVVAQRIEALSGAHDILAEHDWDVAGLRQTVERALRPFNADGRIHCSGHHDPATDQPAAGRPRGQAARLLHPDRQAVVVARAGSTNAPNDARQKLRPHRSCNHLHIDDRPT